MKARTEAPESASDAVFRREPVATGASQAASAQPLRAPDSNAVTEDPELYRDSLSVPPGTANAGGLSLERRTKKKAPGAAERGAGGEEQTMGLCLERKTDVHRHQPRLDRAGVPARAAVLRYQYPGVSPRLPVVRLAQVGAGELSVVEDVVHLRPELQAPPFSLDRKTLREGHVPVVHVRVRYRE